MTASLTADIFLNQTDFLNSLSDPNDLASWIESPVDENTTILGTYDAPVASDLSGNDYSFSFTEGGYDTVDGIAPTIDLIETMDSNFAVEVNASQSGATTQHWGFDTNSSVPGGTNATAILDFTESATDIFSFALETADFEGSGPDGARPAFIGAYDDDGNLIESQLLAFPAPHYGDEQVQFFGFNIAASQSATGIGYIALFVGDDDAGGTGITERVALGSFSAGIASNVPEPSSGLLLFAGLIAIATRRKSSTR